MTTAENAPDAGSAVRLCGLDDLADGEAMRVDVDGERIAVARIGDRWFAIGDECSHADYSLGEGEVDGDECTLECWKHGSQFSLETGEPLTLPATQSVTVYPVTINEREVMVTLPSATISGEDPAAPGTTAAEGNSNE